MHQGMMCILKFRTITVCSNLDELFIILRCPFFIAKFLSGQRCPVQPIESSGVSFEIFIVSLQGLEMSIQLHKTIR